MAIGTVYQEGSAAPMSSQQRPTGAALGRTAQTPPRKVALIFGVLFLITFVASIAAVILYAPVLHPAK
ncbi:MAG: hypothetical protein M3018_12900, partial [Actinomycetota bacterium]|nr:hypothetical protein [Actinomycetota bacterium]